MDLGRSAICVGSRKKVIPLNLLLGLLLVTVLMSSAAFAETRVVSLPTQFDRFLQVEFLDLAGIPMYGQTLSIDFLFENGDTLQSTSQVWAELFLQTGPHSPSNPNGDYPYSQYVVFESGTTAHLLNAYGERMDTLMSDWNGGATVAPAPTYPVVSTDRGVAGADMLAYPYVDDRIGGVHYDIVLPNTGETIYSGRISLRLDSLYPTQVPTHAEISADIVRPDTAAIRIVDNFVVPDLGLVGYTANRNGAFAAGHGRIQPSGATTPSGLVILGYHNAGVLVGEVAIPDVPLITSGRIYAEVSPDGRVNTGMVITNPGNQAATIDFEMRDEQGIVYRTGNFTLTGADVACDAGVVCNQLTRTLDEEPYLGGNDVRGTLSFTSNRPVAVFAARGTRTGSTAGDYSTTPLPVIDLSISPTREMQVIPHFAVGEGRKSEFLMVNPTGTLLMGLIEFIDPYGNPVLISIDGRSYRGTVAYSIAPNGSKKFVIDPAFPGLEYGSIRVLPTDERPAPTPLIVHGYAPDEIPIFELGVPVKMGTAFRVYAEFSAAEQIRTAIAIANTTESAGTVWMTLTGPDGSFIAGTSSYLPASGQILDFVDSLIPALANQTIRGVLRITTDVAGLSVVGLRARYNERGQLLFTSIVPVLENEAPDSEERFFPYVVNGGGFTTQIVLYSGKQGQSSQGSLTFIQSDGRPFDLEIP
jgi:hypothetical protein